MFNIVLVEPEIPPNTGNVIRLCANTGCTLHLVAPLGFTLDDTKLKRAGLDYHEFVNLRHYRDFTHFVAENKAQQERFFALTTKGNNTLQNEPLNEGDFFIFGKETAGLSTEQLALCRHRVRLPMLPQSRSMNLGNTVAITVYEAWRQNGFVNAL